MKYYRKQSDGLVYAFESDGSQDAWIAEDMVLMTEAEVAEHLASSQPSQDELAARSARIERERLLRGVYDPGILMALRALRMASTPEETAYAQGKITELDVYAELLTAIPDQAGFPQTIVWPVVPTK